MSTSRPATREELKEYCLRALGKPVIQINVDDTQLEDRIDQALEYFQDYHFDGTLKTFLKRKITASTLTVTNVSGTFDVGEVLIGGTTNARCEFLSINDDETEINFQYHITGSGVVEVDSSDTFTAGETVSGSSSGATAEVVSVTFGDIDNGWIPVGDDILGVIRVLPFFEGSTTRNMFDVRYQIHLNDIFDLNAFRTSLTDYYLTMRHIQLLNELFSGQPTFRFNRHTNRLYLDIDWRDDVKVNDYVVAEAYTLVDPSDYSNVYNDIFLKKYTTELFRLQWGTNLIKYQGVQLPGGITLDGRTIYEEAKRNIEKLEEDTYTKYSLPADFMVG